MLGRQKFSRPLDTGSHINPVATVRSELPVPTVGVDARAAIGREERVDADFVTSQAQALPARRHKSSSHS
jgi:hypothetical protein